MLWIEYSGSIPLRIFYFFFDLSYSINKPGAQHYFYNQLGH